MTNLLPQHREVFDKFKNPDRQGELKRLAIFDSGLGGLSLLKYLAEAQDDKQDNKEIIYLADTERFPYGMKSAQEIFTYTQQIIRWLERKNVDLIVFGCNTANAIVGDRLNNISRVPILDLIDPVARHVSSLGLRTGVLATQATVNSHAFKRAVNKYDPKLTVTEIAATQLVNIVEKGDATSKETQDLLHHFMEQFLSQDIELLVLGCTHFSFLKKYLLPLTSNKMKLLDPAELIVQLIKTFFVNDTQTTNRTSLNYAAKEITFFVTGDTDAFASRGAKCLGHPLKNVNKLFVDVLESENNLD